MSSELSPIQRRAVYAVLYEAIGLVILMVPFLAWWMQVGLLEALIYDIALVVFFGIYTLGFTWAFDRVFGLPQSAR